MRDFPEMIRQLRTSGILDPLQDEAAQYIIELREALRPFAMIALERDTYGEDGRDMIDGPDLCITPSNVRAARKVLAR
jgi:hypothetical protein